MFEQNTDGSGNTDVVKLMIILGSVRPGRVGLSIALWVHEHASEFDGFDIDFVDLAELQLPFMDEPNHPRLQRYTHKHTLEWSARVAEADAFLFVTPECNQSYSPVLKNALDFLFHEWANKPVGIVSYGGTAGGGRGVVALRPVLSAVGLFGTRTSIEIPSVTQQIDDGFFVPIGHQNEKLATQLRELRALAPALREAVDVTVLSA